MSNIALKTSAYSFNLLFQAKIFGRKNQIVLLRLLRLNSKHKYTKLN
jgi:hypothetical protein